jgi:uncharacterized protein YdhG (YjbR/CyaY superfamily)
MTTADGVAAYLEGLAPETRMRLDAMRATIRDIMPDAIETISYGIPTFTLAGHAIVHVAAWRHHLSLYPVPRVDAGLKGELEPYRSGPGTLRFPLDDPPPPGLIGRVVELLVAQRAGRPDKEED